MNKFEIEDCKMEIAIILMGLIVCAMGFATGIPLLIEAIRVLNIACIIIASISISIVFGLTILLFVLLIKAIKKYKKEKRN